MQHKSKESKSKNQASLCTVDILKPQNCLIVLTLYAVIRPQRSPLFPNQLQAFKLCMHPRKKMIENRANQRSIKSTVNLEEANKTIPFSPNQGNCPKPKGFQIHQNRIRKRKKGFNLLILVTLSLAENAPSGDLYTCSNQDFVKGRSPTPKSDAFPTRGGLWEQEKTGTARPIIVLLDAGRKRSLEGIRTPSSFCPLFLSPCLPPSSLPPFVALSFSIVLSSFSTARENNGCFWTLISFSRLGFCFDGFCLCFRFTVLDSSHA